jgi:signal transduction histidine kinase
MGETVDQPRGIKSSKIRINTRLAILVAVLLVVSLSIIVVLSTMMQQSRAEQEMLEKSRILSKQMNAVWEFIEINQDLIDTDSDGSYNFKGIYCAIAGKSIAVRFGRDTNYTIRYISEHPRKQSAYPDSFEGEAFASFLTGKTEYYGVVEYENEDVFRYVTPLYVEDTCLRCHGEPAGEIDMTGFPKEGLKVGDVGGAISVIVPIQSYMESVEGDTRKQIIFIFTIVLLLTGILYAAVTRLIMHPLLRLKEAAGQVEEGNLGVDIDEIHAVGEIRDLTRQFGSMTRRLQSSYESLESQVSVRTEQLEAANEVLEQQRSELERVNQRLQDDSKYKSDFLAIMSHELRTPLTSIIAFTEMWESSADNKDKAEHEAIREIKENGQLLLQMINNILEAARLEAGRDEVSLEEVDLVDLFGAVQDSVGFIAEKRSIDFATDVDPAVPIFAGDWGKLRRILENLASNAIKFTARGGRVRMTAAYDAVANEVVMQVSDTGVGIREESLPHIFDRFAQSDFSSYRRYSGSGLGLAVVKDLVSLLGGSIMVESVYHQGSTFTVRIPTNLNDASKITPDDDSSDGATITAKHASESDDILENDAAKGGADDENHAGR